MIKLENVVKSYRMTSGARKFVLNGLTAVLPTGANVALLGKNGVGKTTLLRLIGGIDLPDSGRIDTNQRISPPFGLRGGLSGQLTGRDNAKFVCRIQGANAQLAEKISYVRFFSDLGAHFDQPVSTYSSGMRARLAFALSMAFDYDYYLVDELISVGDLEFRKKARAAFAEKRGRASVILVSHNLRLLKTECDSAIYLRNGTGSYYSDIRAAIEAYQQDQGVGSDEESVEA